MPREGYVDEEEEGQAEWRHQRSQQRQKSKCLRGHPSGDSFQNASRWMLTVSQFFGIIPLIGLSVRRKSQRQLHPSFRWRSPSAIYTLLLLTMSTCETGLCAFQIFEAGFFFGSFGALSFYLLATVSRTLCLMLAWNWEGILKHWRRLEDILLDLPYTVERKGRGSLAVRMNVSFTIFMSLTLCKEGGRVVN